MLPPVAGGKKLAAAAATTAYKSLASYLCTAPHPVHFLNFLDAETSFVLFLVLSLLLFQSLSLTLSRSVTLFLSVLIVIFSFLSIFICFSFIYHCCCLSFFSHCTDLILILAIDAFLTSAHSHNFIFLSDSFFILF